MSAHWTLLPEAIVTALAGVVRAERRPLPSFPSKMGGTRKREVRGDASPPWESQFWVFLAFGSGDVHVVMALMSTGVMGFIPAPRVPDGWD
jgi:hypothetical protein